MKHRFNIMGVKPDGHTTGLSVIAEDMTDAIRICRNLNVNPHNICQAEQVSKLAASGLVTIYDNV